MIARIAMIAGIAKTEKSSVHAELALFNDPIWAITNR
jgi:hypothetical protein